VPIDLPDLDTLQYASVRDMLIGQIPIVAPEWTDFNDSDPGIALIQLFAYVADQLGFRMNQIPERNYLEFLNLLGVTLRPAEAATT
jgi:predicted phage baseplate assembly protein